MRIKFIYIIFIFLFGCSSEGKVSNSGETDQIINDFLCKEFKEYFDFTPHDFGEKAHELIMEWGIKKAKDMNEQ